jgi:hypothetical protein
MSVEAALKFLKDRINATPRGTVGGLNRLPYSLCESVAEVMDGYAKAEVADVSRAMKALEERVLTGAPHPSHVWSGTAMNACIRCEAFQGTLKSILACDPSPTPGKFESCCECGNDYPRSDLIAGHIFCPTCRSSRSGL